MPTVTISEQPGLKRLVLLDSQNLIHSFTKVFRFQSGESLHPAALLLMAYDLTNLGFNVRVISRRQAVSSPVHMYDLPFVFEMLKQCNLLMVPAESKAESDDLMMLDLAQKHGAVIITNDRMTNHQKQMQTDFTKNLIGFHRVKNDAHDTCNFLEKLEGMLKIEFVKPDASFYCPKDDPDYEKVLASQKEFVLFNRKRQYLLFSELYLRCYVGCCYDFDYQNKMLPAIRELVFGNDWCVRNIKTYFEDVIRLIKKYNNNGKSNKRGDVVITQLLQSLGVVIA